MDNEPRLYREEGHKMPRPKFLPEDVYSQAISGFVIDCTDAVICDHKRKTIWLAKRNVEPAKNFLWIIGGRRFPGETRAESVQRCFLRETGLNIAESRFNYLLTNEYIWARRQQKPEKLGSHNIAHTYSVELSSGEISCIKLSSEEYHTEFGLREFDREDLVNAGVYPAILDIYDKIFPS